MQHRQVWTNSNSKGSARLVLLAIDSVTGDDGKGRASLSDLCEMTRLSLSTVVRAIESLEKSGEISCDTQKFCTTEYTILLGAPTVSQFDNCQIDNTQIDNCQIDQRQDGTHTSSTPPPLVNLTIVNDDLNNNNNNKYNTSFGLDDQPDPVHEISQHFQAVAGVLPSRSAWEVNWQAPIEMWLAGADVPGVKKKIDRAVEIARGKNDSGTRYRITSPRSLVSFMSNLPPEDECANGDKLWAKVIKAITSGDYGILNHREKTAVRSVGVPTIRARTASDEKALRTRLVMAYNGAGA